MLDIKKKNRQMDSLATQSSDALTTAHGDALGMGSAPPARRSSLLRSMYWIAKGVGWDNVPRRIWQAYLVRSGGLRRRLDTASYSWPRFPNKSLSPNARMAQWQARKRLFFPIPQAAQVRDLVEATVWETSVTRVCNQALEGNYRFFSRWYGRLQWPPNFNLDPVNNINWPVGEHWLDTARSGAPRDDIKLVWEASRFSLVFDMARQYVVSGDAKWAERLWEFIEAWIEQNPVNQSVAWGCGQEVAFRLMALLTGVFTVIDSPHTTAARLAQVELLCWQSAKRIEANLNYARSQENNHGLSEATGLWTVGLLFPAFPESKRWAALGKRVLESETQRQIYSDGCYVQHSMSYHRVMLDDLCWAIQLGRQQGLEFSQRLLKKLAVATTWLKQFVDPSNGRVPNYGANDGANVLPLACSDYLDYRPTLQLAADVSGVDSGLALGPWSEKALWLLGKLPKAGNSSRLAQAWSAEEGGYYVLRGPHSYLMTRATKYRDRPGQCDTLHVDLWYRGLNILRDAGSYRYYHADRQLKNYFYSVAAHNTVQVGDSEQMIKGPNFLWFNWPKAQAHFNSPSELECSARFTASIPYTHRRRIRQNGDSYTLVDEVSGAEPFVVRWRLAPELDWRQTQPKTIAANLPDGGDIEIRFVSDASSSLVISLEEAWESLYYGERRLCPAVVVSNVHGRLETVVEARG